MSESMVFKNVFTAAAYPAAVRGVYMKKFLKATWIFYPLILAAAMYFFLPMFPSVTEYVFSRGLFKAVTVPLGFVTSLIPVSLTELLVVLALPLTVFLAVLLAVRIKRSKSRAKTVLKAARGTATFLSFTCLMYMVCHCANYYRLSMERLMQLDTSPKTAEQLLYVCRELAAGAREAREETATDEDGCMVFTEDIWTELIRAGSGYENLTEEYPFLWTGVWRQKPVQLSYYWSYTGIVGMYFPFFAECNINIEQPDWCIPFTAAHESAHSRGIAFENECNFLAFLSCINSEYPEYRYSGYMNAFLYCSNALYAYDKDMWREAHAECTEGMIRDFNANNEYINRFKGKVKEVSHKANDTFIRVQGVKDGSLSYDRVTELILAYYEK